MCLAIGTDLLAYKTQGGTTAAECLVKSLTGIQAGGTSVNITVPEVEQEKEKGCGWGEYICALFPFYLACCSPLKIRKAKDRVVGLPKLIE